MFFFFFFQAEDGIRDYKVTGVQTCALPIYSRSAPARLPRLLSPARSGQPIASPTGRRGRDQRPDVAALLRVERSAHCRSDGADAKAPPGRIQRIACLPSRRTAEQPASEVLEGSISQKKPIFPAPALRSPGARPAK